jgi:hypothetical protein
MAATSQVLQRGLGQEDTKSNQDRARMDEFSKNAQFGGDIEELGRRVFSTRSVEELCMMMQYNGLP